MTPDAARGERHASVQLPPDAVPGAARRLRRAGVGDVPNELFDPAARAPALQPVPRRAGLRRGAGLRRRLRQRAPPERLRADAVAQPHRRRAGPRDAADEDRRHRQRAAALQPADAGRRGVRHARRHLRRPAHRRLGRRRRPRVLLVLDQPDLRPRALRRGPRPDPARRGPSRARSSSSASTTACATSTPGPGRCSSRTRRSGSRAPARSRRWSSSPSTATPTWASRTSTSTVFERTFAMFREACDAGRLHLRPRPGGLGDARSTWPRPTSRPGAEFEPHFWYFAQPPAARHHHHPAGLHVACGRWRTS